MTWQPTMPLRAIVKSLIDVSRFFGRPCTEGLIRLGLIGGIGTCLLAIWLGRIAPEPERSRILAKPLFEVIDGGQFDRPLAEARLLDATSGVIGRFPLPEGERIREASCSPWHDDRGEYQVVGRTNRIEANGSFGGEVNNLGMARYSLPSGRILDRAAIEIAPISHPCWYPGTSARVLYAGVDCKLYRFDFDAKPSRTSEVVWKCPEPGRDFFVRDPVWPRDPRMKGKLVVSLSFQGPVGDWGGRQWRLWWLGLNEDGSAVTSAGPMCADESRPNTNERPVSRRSELRPNLATTPDGRVVLAYIMHGRTNARWQLRLVQVTFDPTTGDPLADWATSTAICEDHDNARPFFSTDGGSLFAIVRSETPQANVVRFPIGELPASE